jgi:hypothetical protein
MPNSGDHGINALYAQHLGPMKINTIFALLLAFTLTSTPSIAQKVGLRVESISRDTVGRYLTSEFKHKIKESDKYKIASKASMIIKMNSMARSEKNPSAATVYSVIWTVPASGSISYFYKSTLGICGANRVGDIAQSLMEDTNQYAIELAEALQKEREREN